MRRVHVGACALTLLAFGCLAARAAEDAPGRATVRVDASKVLRTMDHRMLLGTNLAVWNSPDCFSTPQVTGWIRDLGTGLIRIPGGSYSDIVYWNGNGVRDRDGKIDPGRMKDGYPAIDYSAYAPSILVDEKRAIPANGWGGNVDVKTLHDFVQSVGAPALVCVNAGTGRPVDAAEWVRWSGRMGYKVSYWEVGNELGGSWEAGHYLADGTELTGPLYAERFEQFAQAMKAVDPTIKVGCMDWIDDVMGRCGKLVDFLSWHSYPLRASQSHEEMLALAVSEPARIATAFRDAVHKYQPGREGQVKLGVSEWNLGLSGGLEPDTFADVWTSIYIGELFRDGIDFANQWDAFTGDGALVMVDGAAMRKGQYWVFWLWDHYMGDSLVECGVEGGGPLTAYATASADAVYVMLINPSTDLAAEATVNLDGFEPAREGECAALDQRGYFWNSLTHRPDWSDGPTVLPLGVGKSFQVEVPPLSVQCVRIPSATRPAISELARQGAAAAQRPAGQPELRIQIAGGEFTDMPLGGWVKAYRAGTDEPYPVALPPARLEVTGPASADRAQVRLAEAAGRFVLRASAAGSVTVKASVDGAESTAAVEFKAPVPRARVLWEFEQPALGKGYTSSWKLSTDDSVRANQRVARIDLKNALPDRDHQSLLIISDFPPADQLDRANIRGVFFDMMISSDLQCDDPDARLEVVMQSPADYWMSLGSVPLSGSRGHWTTSTFAVTDEKHIKAVPFAYNVWFALRANKPVTGAVYIDKAGLMVR